MSSFSAPRSGYTLTAILLHWLLGVALLGMVAMGVYMADLPFSPLRLKLFNWHKWAGVCILILSVLRLVWRLMNTPPMLPLSVEAAMPSWQRLASQATHYAFYALFFVIPLLGWAYGSAAGFPIVLFGVWPLPDFVPVDKSLAELIKPWHALSAYLMLALVAAHVAAALKHQWIDKDGLINRILPSRR